jgi:hypothetical protein
MRGADVMEPATTQAMLREDREEWRALCAVLDAHPEGPLHDPESPAWTARDVYTHLARWMERSTEALGAWLADGSVLSPLDGTDDEINARWQAEDSGLSLDEARAQAQRAFDRLHQAIEAVPLDRWDAMVEAIARADGSEHYRAHRGFIVT